MHKEKECLELSLDETWELCMTMWRRIVELLHGERADAAHMAKAKDQVAIKAGHPPTFLRGLIILVKQEVITEMGFSAAAVGGPDCMGRVSGPRVESNCFFCAYHTSEASKQSKTIRQCSACPAVLIDHTFDCKNAEYSYRYEPERFLEVLEAGYTQYTEIRGERCAQK